MKSVEMPPVLSYPPTVFVVHPKENRAKCSLEPLRRTGEFQFISYSAEHVPELSGYVRLSVEGPPLTAGDADCGILLIDGSWRRAASMHARFAAVSPRSLVGFRTAYPRVSKVFDDPPDGLASIEALYIAHRILGRPTAGLLNGYRWRDEFLSLNGWPCTRLADRDYTTSGPN